VTSTVINLVRRRRERAGEPSIADACTLIEGWFDSLALVPPVREELGRSFGVILDAVVDGDERAITTWRRIERAMKAPLRAREPGEPGYQRMIDRLATVDALAQHFRMMQK
jgi:hypothetical protein